MQSWGLTDQGCVRKQNQDAYQIEQLDRGGLLCVVCDGMGGAKSGNIASSLAVDVFVQEIKRSWKPGMDQERINQMLTSAVKLANFTVFDQAQQFEEFDGMGTTLVAVLIKNRRATIINVGDSRAYHITRDGIRQISRDHSLVEALVERGELTPEEAKHHPQRNLITRALGPDASVQADSFYVEWKQGDFLLLCSDGLVNTVSDQEILFEVIHSGEPDTCLARLVALSRQRGAPDNVTAVLLMNI